MSARRPPPADPTLEQALALGGMRVGTYAHPDCRCLDRKPPQPVYELNEGERYVREMAAWEAEHGSPREDVYGRRNCPVHVGTAGGA